MPDFRSYVPMQPLENNSASFEYTLARIKKMIHRKVGLLKITLWKTKEPLPFSQRMNGKRLKLSIGDKWGELFDCGWFRFQGKVPQEAKGREVVLLLDVNGEMCVMDDDGNPVIGLTSASSAFFRLYGEPDKKVLRLTPHAAGCESIDVWADAGCNDLVGEYKSGTIADASICVCNEEIRRLYYDFEVLLCSINYLPKDTARSRQIRMGLLDVCRLLDKFTEDEVAQARTILRPLLSKKGGDPSLVVSAIGNSHIDLGFLWPIRETIRKGIRTFSTALSLMDRYPDYIFGASQPQLFEWIKEESPHLYERVRQKVLESRFDLFGCTWVENDLNLVGAESIVRQIIYGKRFFQQEFGVVSRNYWLPDSFGFSPAVPQIMKQAGVDYFLTQKLHWSNIDKNHNFSFKWKGIDGTEVLAHMLPELNYVSPASPMSLKEIEKNYIDSDISDRVLMLFGIGDGGGGPGEEHLERLQRLKDFAGFCPVHQDTAKSFFDDWAKDADRFVTWTGELYLERHQGTLTTQAASKRYNRQMELSLRNLEWLSCMGMMVNSAEYPALWLEAAWKETLLYQFHDILPGTSIKRVYDESLPRYRAMLEEADRHERTVMACLASRIDTGECVRPVALFNTLSWERIGWERVSGRWMQVRVPPMGYCVVDAAREERYPTLSASADGLENDLLKIRFDTDGAIVSIFDKTCTREIVERGKQANVLTIYRDEGDAWDFRMDYDKQPKRRLHLVSASANVEGACASMEHTYDAGYSRIIQQVTLLAGSKLIEFNTKVIWRETNAMLRTSFPVDIRAEQASFDIQFGHVWRNTHRNTTWDLAKDEVPANKWADLSQGDYGVALLNDCKYGHRVKENTLDLNLIRSVVFPDPNPYDANNCLPGQPNQHYTDQCDHTFRYALLPHFKDAVEGGVIQAAYEFNIPLLEADAGGYGKRPLLKERSFLQTDNRNVIIEAVKKAEDGNELIVRLYEASHADAFVNIQFDFDVVRVVEVNLLEEEIGMVEPKGGGAILHFRPFEIKTLKIFWMKARD